MFCLGSYVVRNVQPYLLFQAAVLYTQLCSNLLPDPHQILAIFMSSNYYVVTESLPE